MPSETTVRPDVARDLAETDSDLRELAGEVYAIACNADELLKVVRMQDDLIGLLVDVVLGGRSR